MLIKLCKESQLIKNNIEKIIFQNTNLCKENIELLGFNKNELSKVNKILKENSYSNKLTFKKRKIN